MMPTGEDDGIAGPMRRGRANCGVTWAKISQSVQLRILHPAVTSGRGDLEEQVRAGCGALDQGVGLRPRFTARPLPRQHDSPVEAQHDAVAAGTKLHPGRAGARGAALVAMSQFEDSAMPRHVACRRTMRSQSVSAASPRQPSDALGPVR